MTSEEFRVIFLSLSAEKKEVILAVLEVLTTNRYSELLLEHEQEEGSPTG